jgi:hypothetical protein
MIVNKGGGAAVGLAFVQLFVCLSRGGMLVNKEQARNGLKRLMGKEF